MSDGIRPRGTSDGTRGFVRRLACPVCASHATRTLYESSYAAAPLRDYLLRFYGDEQGSAMLPLLADTAYVLRECSACALVYQVDAPDEIMVETLYDRWIDSADALRRDHARALHAGTEGFQEVLQLVATTGKRPDELAVLDFGMGWARWLQVARSLGCRVAGAEVSKDRVAHARGLGIDVLEWEEIPDHRFDIINAEQVFEHLVDPVAVGRHLASSLAPGGILKICVPNGADIRRRLRRMDWEAPKYSRNSLNDVAPLEHLNCFGPRSLEALRRRLGLSRGRIPLSVYYRYAFPWDGPVHYAKQLVKPLYRNIAGRGAYVLFVRA